MGGPKNGRKHEIRRANEENLLRAAQEVFARAGFAGARVAEIAAMAGVPKSNLHYYFSSKRKLYRAVLANIVELWLSETRVFTPEADPRAAIEQYVRAKMTYSRSYPAASRVFANEIVHQAPEIRPFLKSVAREIFQDKTSVVEGWIRAGRMAPVDPRHLFIIIWSATQTYADFATQIEILFDVERLSDEEFDRATEQVVAMILRACGFYYEPRLVTYLPASASTESAGTDMRR